MCLSNVAQVICKMKLIKSVLYLHWAISGRSLDDFGRPLIDSLKVGLAEDFESRKRSYYADGWKDQENGMLTWIPVDTSKYSLKVLEFLTQIIMAERYLGANPSLKSLEIFPWSSEAVEKFKSLTPEKIYLKSAGQALRILEGVSIPIKKKAREEIVNYISQGLYDSMGNKVWEESDLYDLEILSSMMPDQAYRYIIRPGLDSLWKREGLTGYIRIEK